MQISSESCSTARLVCDQRLRRPRAFAKAEFAGWLVLDVVVAGRVVDVVGEEVAALDSVVGVVEGG